MLLCTVQSSRTCAAVHEESTLLEKLSGHTAPMLARIVSISNVLVLREFLDVLHGDWFLDATIR